LPSCLPPALTPTTHAQRVKICRRTATRTHTHGTPTTMDYQPSPRAGANDLNSPGLVFRGRAGTTPRTSSNPSGFEVQVDLETQQSAAGMGGSNGTGAGRVSSGSGASAGLPYMQQQQQQQQYQRPPEVCMCRGREEWEMCICMRAWAIGRGPACHRAFPAMSYPLYLCVCCAV
jgi:hypothetical protein